MANIIFTIPSVLNAGGGEKKLKFQLILYKMHLLKISELLGDDFKRRVLEADNTPRSLINIYINGKNAKFSSGMETLYKMVMKCIFYLQLLVVLKIFLQKNLIDIHVK